MLLPVQIPDVWGVDTSSPISPARLAVLMTVDLRDFYPGAPKGSGVGFFGRYGPLPGVNPGQDISRAELALLAPRAPVVLFQHVRFDHWIASAAQGTADAQHLAAHALSVGYAPVDGYPAPSLIKDCEAVGNPGPACVACTQAFHDAIDAASYGPSAYRGFDPGLTDAQFAALGCPLCSSTPVNPPPPGRGFAYCQVRQVVIDGQSFDVAWHRADLAGARLVGIADITMDVEPHVDPSGPNVDS